MDIAKSLEIAVISIFSTVVASLKLTFGWLPNIPNFSEDMRNFFFDFLAFPSKSGALGFVGWIFGSFTVIGWVLGISFMVLFAKYIYNFIMFLLTKLPILGISR